MRKHFSPARLTAMLLVFCVTAALLCVPAFADTTDPVTVSATADGETAAVTYEGNVNVTADSTAAVEADAAGTAPNSSVTASIEGNVSVTGDNSAAVQVQALGNFSEVTVDINGDVSASGEDSAAIAVDNKGLASQATVNVEGDVSAAGTGSAAVEAVAQWAVNNSVDVNINGNVTAADTYGYAISASSSGGASVLVTVNVTGDVTQTGPSTAAIYVEAANNCAAVVNVDGNVSGPSAGIEANCGGIAGCTVTVTGDVYGDAMGIRAEGAAGRDYVAVGGDATGGDMGIQIWNGAGKDIFVGGTASGSMYGLVADPSTVNEEICDVTVWKIDGDILATESFCQNAIHYIVKHAEGESGTGFTSTGEGGSALTQYHGYDTAQEGQVIILTPDAGKQILEAYNGSVKLTADANGVFSFVVPRGGGILLSVKFGEAGGEETQVIIFVLSFDLGGGKMPEGEELPAAVVAGQKITLPAAPEREGYKFVGWEVTVHGEKVILQPGEKFTVTADKTFTAIWEKE